MLSNSNIQEGISKLKKLPYLNPPYSSRAWGHKLHSLCSYQSKLKPAIAYFLAQLFSDRDSLILDPFCGVGTIPFEFAQKGVRTVSVDINPIAYCCSYSKLKRFDITLVNKQIAELNEFIDNNEPTTEELSYADEYIRRFYHEKTLREILLAMRFFKENEKGYEFIEACILHILHGNRPYSLSRISHNITPYAPRGEFVYKPLIKSLREKAIRTLREPRSNDFREGEVYLQDFLTFDYKEKFDAIVTSPPFVNSTRFLYNNRIRLWFNGLSYADQQRQEGYLDTKSINVFEDVIRKFNYLLKENGTCVLHLGVVKNLDMGKVIGEFSERNNFKVLDLIYEDVDGREKFGIKDQGATHKHEFLVIQKV